MIHSTIIGKHTCYILTLALLVLLPRCCTVQAQQIADSAIAGKTSIDSGKANLPGALDSVRKPARNTYLDEPVSKNSFSRVEWLRLKKGLDYSEDVPPKPKATPSLKKTFNNAPAITADWIKYVLLIAVIALLAFILYKLLSGRLNNQKVKSDEILASVERIEDIELVPESELERLLRLAIAAGDFKEAVRIWYVLILRDLTVLRLIQWEKNKTNRAYVAEMERTPYSPVFRELTLKFEKIWYGDVGLLEVDYMTLGDKFKMFSNALKLEQNREK